MRTKTTEIMYPLPVVGADWDQTFNNTKGRVIYKEYSSFFIPSLGRQIHKPAELLWDYARRTGYCPGEGQFTINGVAVGSTSDVYSDHKHLGGITIDNLRKDFPNDPYLPTDEKGKDHVLNEAFKETKPKVEIPFRPDAYLVLSQLLRHHINGKFFFFIYTSSHPDSIRAAIQRLDKELAEEFNAKGEIFQCIKHVVAQGRAFARTPDGRRIPKYVYFPEFRSESVLRRPLLYEGIMQAQRKAHHLKEGEVVDLRRTNTILTDDNLNLGLTLADFLGAKTILFGDYGPGEFSPELTAWNGKQNWHPNRYIVNSLSGALLLIFHLTGIKVDVNNLDMQEIILNALEKDYTLKYGIQTPLLNIIKGFFEGSNVALVGTTLHTLYDFKMDNGVIIGRDTQFKSMRRRGIQDPASEIYMFDDNMDENVTAGFYNDRISFKQWEENKHVEDEMFWLNTWNAPPHTFLIESLKEAVKNHRISYETIASRYAETPHVLEDVKTLTDIDINDLLLNGDVNPSILLIYAADFIISLKKKVSDLSHELSLSHNSKIASSDLIEYFSIKYQALMQSLMNKPQAETEKESFELAIKDLQRTYEASIEEIINVTNSMQATGNRY